MRKKKALYGPYYSGCHIGGNAWFSPGQASQSPRETQKCSETDCIRDSIGWDEETSF